MADVRVKPVSVVPKRESLRELYALVCWYYPQYTLKDVQNLPGRDVQLLLKTASKMEARQYLALTQIAAAPHTKKGQGVKNLITEFKKAAR